MSDLISRSDVLKLPRYNFGVSMLTSEEYIKVSDIKKILTAYSVDNVVEELKKIEEHCLEMNDWQGQSTVVDAIEIVKQGCTSDDCCEWIKYDYRTMCPKNHDAKNPYWRIPVDMDKLKYCPYCGKKIKVVE